MTESLDERALLERHRAAWDAKRFLRDTYRRYHDRILALSPPGARVLELGAGLGHLTRDARARGHRRWLASDVIDAGSADLRCDGSRLPFRAEAFDRVVFVDVLHHVAAPRAFLGEASRVLAPGGKIVAVEPWASPLGVLFYRFVHDEGCDLGRDVERPFPAGKPAYEGDAGLATLVCRKLRAWDSLGLTPPRVRPFNDFGWLATRGLRPGPDPPAPLYWLARSVLDGTLQPLASLLGLRALIAWEKRPARPR